MCKAHSSAVQSCEVYNEFLLLLVAAGPGGSSLFTLTSDKNRVYSSMGTYSLANTVINNREDDRKQVCVDNTSRIPPVF